MTWAALGLMHSPASLHPSANLRVCLVKAVQPCASAWLFLAPELSEAKLDIWCIQMICQL